MDLVLFHSEETLPTYLQYTFKQIRIFNPNLIIHFITDVKHFSNPVFAQYNVCVYDKEVYYLSKIEELSVLMKRKADDFWMITMTRLVYIENFIFKHNLKNVYYFENDVLLYYNLEEHDSKFKKLYPYLAITKGSTYKCMTGFMFIKNYLALSLMTRFFIEILSKHGHKGLFSRYATDMIHEMFLMSIYGKERNPIFMKYLPTLPASQDFEIFNSIYDPAAWGQYVGGTQNEGPGAKPLDHDISKVLIKHPEYAVMWKKDSEDRNIPYFKYEGKEVKINNLHIHSKNLHLYLSK